MTVYASDSEGTLTVTAAWVDGELLRINVADVEGVSSALSLRLSDYVNDAASESAIQDGSNPLTPNGSGTVMDNAIDGDGKEFFTIRTESGGEFYLIVDRNRNADNVYFLNTVTLDDLVALADKNGQSINTDNNDGTSAIETSGQPNGTVVQHPSPTNSPDTAVDPSETTPAKKDTSMYIFIGIAVVAVGVTGYYFKIIKGKQNAPDDDDDNDGDDDDDADDADEYGYSNDSDDEDEDGNDEE